MDPKIVKGSQRQLRGLADALGNAGDGNALALMLQTGSFLLNRCADSGNEFAAMSDEAFEDAMDAMAAMAEKIVELAVLPRCGDALKWKDQIDQLKRSAEAIANRGKDLQSEAQKLTKLNDSAEQINREQENQLEQLKQRGEEITADIQRVQEQMDRCGEENMRRLEYFKVLQAEWRSVDADTKHLVAKIESMEKTLERLRDSGEDFTEARQEQLQTQIDEMAAKVERRKGEINGLNEKLAQLRECRKTLDGQHEALEADVLDAISGMLEEMNSDSMQLLQRLESAKNTAQTLRERFDQCLSMQADDTSRMEANEALIDKLSRILGENDPLNSSLRATMDFNQTEKLRALRESVRDELRQIDELLALCVRAMSENRRNVLNKVSQGPSAKGGQGG